MVFEVVGFVLGMLLEAAELVLVVVVVVELVLGMVFDVVGLVL